MSDDLDFEMEVVEDGELGSTASPSEGSIKPDDAANDDRSSTELVESKEEASSRFEGLPEAWAVHKLQEAAKVVGGSTPSTNNDEYWGGDMPWATPTDVTGLRGTTITETEDKITEEGLNSASTHILPEYSVLMTSRATIGACAVNTVPMATNQGFQSLVPGERLNTWYLFYRMLNEAPYLESLGAGSTFSEVSKRVVEKIDIPVPPLPEQREIASVLYAVDQAIQKTEAIIEQAKRVKRGLMQELLQNGLGSRPTEIIRLSAVDSTAPEHWSVVTIGEVARKITDGAHLTPDRTEDGYLLLSARNVKNGYLDLSEVDHVPEEEYQRLTEKCHPESGDVLISCSGTVGRVCLVPEDMEFAMVRSAALVKLGDEVLPEYMEQVLQGAGVQKQIKGYQTQSAQPNLFQGQIARIEIPVPPKDEQKKISKVLRDWDSSVRQGVEYKDKLQRLKKGLMQDLLTGEVRTADKAIEVLDEVAAHG